MSLRYSASIPGEYPNLTTSSISLKMSLPERTSPPPSASNRPLETFSHSTASTHPKTTLSSFASQKSNLHNDQHSNHQQTPPNILNPLESYLQPLPQDAIDDKLTNSIPIPDCKSSLQVTHTMDPFECRVRFTNLIINLNATTTSAVKAAQYALKYRDMDEDLHSCIIEQLERVCPLLTSLLFVSYYPKTPSSI